MTGIIISKLENSSGGEGFSIIGFYIARARRIIPALLALCAILLLGGWFALPASEYRLLATHVISSLGFFSNIKFWSEGGYFDVGSHDKWLLHTWSLSVEWQFYLILPLMLAFVWKIRPGRQSANLLIIATFVASLAFCIVHTSVDPSASFYLLPTRAWEMLAGGIVYLASQRIALAKTSGKLIESIGFALILYSILMFSSSTAWPSAWAIVPVIGAVLILCSAQTQSVWTGSRVAQWLGARSYSLYLWHWPLVVILVYFGLQHNAGVVTLALILTLLLGELSYRLVENPTRRRLEGLKTGSGTVIIAVALLAVAMPAMYVWLQHGLRGRLDPNLELVFNEASNKNPRIKECFEEGRAPVSPCTYGGDRLGAIVIGDSHAASIVRTVENSLPDKGLHVLDWTMQSCPTLIGVQAQPGGQSQNCGQFVGSSLTKQAALPNDAPLIIVNRTSSYAFGPNDAGREKEPFPSIYFDHPVTQPTAAFLKDFRAAIISTACEFAKTRPVYLVRPIPELKLNVPQVMGRALQLGADREVSITIDEYHERNSFVWEAQDAAREKCGVQILDPTKYLCKNGRCKGAQAGRPLYYDDDHLSEHGASVLRPMFAEIFPDKHAHNVR